MDACGKLKINKIQPIFVYFEELDKFSL